MFFVGFVINVVLNFIIIFCCQYYSNHIYIWYDNNKRNSVYRSEIDIKMPMISDVPRCDDIRKYERYVEEYTKEVILPARDYFNLRDTLKSQLDSAQDAGTVCFAFRILGNAGWALGLSELLFDSSVFMALIIQIAIFLLCSIIAVLFGKFYFGSSKFYYSRDELSAEFERRYHGSWCGISKEESFNNFMLKEHYDYLKGIKYECQRIYDWSRFVEVLSLVVFFSGLLVGLYLS